MPFFLAGFHLACLFEMGVFMWQENTLRCVISNQFYFTFASPAPSPTIQCVWCRVTANQGRSHQKGVFPQLLVITVW
jgi:hypothetical protein